MADESATDRIEPLVPIRLEAHNPGPMTGRGNNTYLLVADDRRATLIDAGVGDRRHLEAIAGELAARRASLARVVVTHAHPDHIAGAASLVRTYPAAVFLKFPPVEDESGVPWRAVADGDLIQIGRERLEVLHTPGHAPDHVVLWHAPTRAAWVGDLVIQGGSVMVDWSKGGRMALYLASLQRLVDLVPETLYPGHGPVIPDPAPVLLQCLAHRRERERQVVDALASGHSTVPSIADSIYDGLDARLVAAARATIAPKNGGCERLRK